MPYPAKTNAETILTVAIAYLERYGEAALSMRELASHLGLTPHALYRYYPDRAALEGAIAAEGFRRLHADIVEAVGERTGKVALQVAVESYLTFEQAHPAWYGLLMRFRVHTPELLEAGHALWAFDVKLLEQVVGKEDAPAAAVALWAFVHGFIQLERAAILGEMKPLSGFQFGLETFLAGLSTTSPHAASC
jgi:AcrR family transcriptional regulator